MAKRPDGRAVDPDFDGHAEKPFEDMTPAERLDWIWDRAVDLHWARSVREASPQSLVDKPAPSDG